MEEKAAPLRLLLPTGQGVWNQRKTVSPPDSEAAEKLRRRNPSSPLQYDAAGSGRCSFEKIFPKGCFPELRPCGAGSGRRCTSPPVGKAAAGLTGSAARRSPTPNPAEAAGYSRTAVPQRVCPVFCSRCRFPRIRPGWNISPFSGSIRKILPFFIKSKQKNENF